jgi:hypothetical protein
MGAEAEAGMRVGDKKDAKCPKMGLNGEAMRGLAAENRPRQSRDWRSQRGMAPASSATT